MKRSLAMALAGFALVAAAGCHTVTPQEILLADSHRDLATAKLAKGEPEAAIAEYRAALAIHPEDADAHFGLAESYRRKEMLADTEHELLETLRIDPNYKEARFALGVTHMQQERYADAVAVFQTLADDPTFIRPTRALVNLGWAHYKSGNSAEAVAALGRALKADGANYVAHLDLGIIAYDQSDWIEAVQHFEACVKIVADRQSEQKALPLAAAEAEAQFRMAQAYVRLDQRERAVAALRAAVERGGESEWARKSSDYLRVLQ
jgi:Tfp pilus assembly protein PilF